MLASEALLAGWKQFAFSTAYRAREREQWNAGLRQAGQITASCDRDATGVSFRKRVRRFISKLQSSRNKGLSLVR
jgi:hypothetical protein